jgi:hypothetical protein
MVARPATPKLMSAIPYKVYVVVDRNFGAQLDTLEVGTPVWIVDTPVNKPVAQRFWKEQSQRDHLTGVTTFKDLQSLTAEDLLLKEIDAIDLHHGPYSSNPPYTLLEIIGTPLTGRVQQELSAYGFDEFHSSPNGFVAKRQAPGPT